jgi:ribonucleotide reductase beta subunit family protein with ferritin-like domain
MKLHTLNREYCLCDRHPRKFKKELTKWSEKLLKALDREEIKYIEEIK